VADTGLGIAEEEREAVFEPFRQTSSGEESREGTGLGMAISQQFVRLMGGDITFHSELGVGTVFEFDVPVKLADEVDIPELRPDRRVIGLAPGQCAADGGAYRLLVAEDHEASRRLLAQLLQTLGFEVREAIDGRQALEVWARWKPHLIWMDVRMPVMDGHEVIQRIKATTLGQSTVVIALTAAAFEEDRVALLSEGCDDYVRKPFREKEIVDVLAKHLDVRFLYEDAADEGPTAEDLLSPALLAALPVRWVTELRQAARQADAELVYDLIDQIRQEDAPLADVLAGLVRDFRFDTLAALAASALGGEEGRAMSGSAGHSELG
jgi:CheY-like chemotaxis protein